MILTDIITMERDEAAEHAARYSELRYPTAEDRVVLAGFLALVAGKQLIDLPAAIRSGGEFDNGLPRLAVMWADQPWCYLSRTPQGHVSFTWSYWPASNARRFDVRDALAPRNYGEYPDGKVRSQVPIIPPQHRPAKSTLRNHAVLWEVEEWAVAPRPPGDPALLRNLAGDLWTVEATWDLTELERLVLGHR